MLSDNQPLFESAPGAEIQAAGDQQSPEAGGPNNDQFIRAWDSLSPSSIFFHQAQASEQAAQSVGSFIRRPMDLPPPTQVGTGVHTAGISRASEALSSVLDQFDQEPTQVQPVRASSIMGGSGVLPLSSCSWRCYRCIWDRPRHAGPTGPEGSAGQLYSGGTSSGTQLRYFSSSEWAAAPGNGTG